MSSFSIPTTNPCITWVGHVLHGLINSCNTCVGHALHELFMQYMGFNTDHGPMECMGSHVLHGTPEVLHEDAYHTCACNWCHMTCEIFVYAV